jgi:hypothetical protein
MNFAYVGVNENYAFLESPKITIFDKKRYRDVLEDVDKRLFDMAFYILLKYLIGEI